MFLVVLSSDGGPVEEREQALYAGQMRRLAGPDVVTVQESAFYAVVAPTMVPHRPLVARRHGLIAIGNVRLDHSGDMRSRGEVVHPDASDLELVLDAYHARGVRCVPDLLGDFAFVICDPQARSLVAARDAFGVRTLFMGRRPGRTMLSSHLELVRGRERLDEEFVADFLLCGDPGPERTIWADAQAVTQGSILKLENGKIATERFWTPYAFQPADGRCERDQIEEFHALFREAVRSRIGPDGGVWAELSGGLDSSSIVVTAVTLTRTGSITGLAGTISIVDELGDGDEACFSDLVVNQYGIRNEVIANPWPWQDDGDPPPYTDEPRTHYPYFSRDRLECETIRAAGGRVLLSGVGADHYLAGNRWFTADSMANGHPARALSQLAAWSVVERTSFWTSLARDAALPFLPRSMQRHCQPKSDRIPPWITPTFGRRVGMAARLRSARTSLSRLGTRFAAQIRDDLQELTRWLPRGAFEDGLELRYPFLYRPLVESGLRLPPPMLVRPLQPKWVLRQGMRGLLPEEIRSRPGKGGIDSRILWALSRERKRIEELLQASVLADLGFIHLGLLRDAIDRARVGDTAYLVKLLAVLSLETWLAVRSGRWNTQTSNRRPDRNDRARVVERR